MPDIAGKLFPNITTIIVQLLSTGVLLFVFKKYLWKPVQNYFAKRADYIESTINEAKDMNDKASVHLDEAEKQAREAAQEYRKILDTAKEDANKQKQQILEEASKDANNKIESARREIETEKLQAKEDMKEEMVNVAIDVASKVIDKNMDSKTNEELVKGFVDDVVN
ncbi:MAG: F0F1 ATP synthase subunit B [Thomasclavelia sp.]|jgi:F-type H+-transporting ATPase subunit b|nr:F0F1 ATP synthase subunit B [Thomasclavelia sp.]